MRSASVSLLSLVMFAATTFPAYAAVRECRDIISSEIASAPTELNAKMKALEQWQVKALKLGPGFDAWRLAYDKSLQCFPKGSSFECVAIGRPCMINQAPGPNLKPMLPIQPKGTGI
jgi:hypothetical protein